MASHGQPAGLLPPLGGPDVPFQVVGNLFPTLQRGFTGWLVLLIVSIGYFAALIAVAV